MRPSGVLDSDGHSLANCGIGANTRGGSPSNCSKPSIHGSENEAANGDPQKMAPCGGTSANPGSHPLPVTKIRGGTKTALEDSGGPVHHPRAITALRLR
jgi:hypothetical protein